ncbi:unknow (plasmid) [Vibrio campbellii]|nr:unknow [Vibrio campbellii]
MYQKSAKSWGYQETLSIVMGFYAGTAEISDLIF